VAGTQDHCPVLDHIHIPCNGGYFNFKAEVRPMQTAYEEINYLQMLLAVYLEQEDKVLATLIMQIQETLEGLKACA
jgi:hypothetical protein